MEVKVDTGKFIIKGSCTGEVNIFRGIPFALPPVGARRFLPPLPYSSENRVIEATHFSPAAMQAGRKMGANNMIEPFRVDEDCLYLNVYTPAARPHQPNGYPVMVWIHGGSGIYGSGSQALYDGQKLAAMGIIVVTINYRLGAFGYLELGNILGPDYKGSANNALKDQLLALRWVKENISFFNGDAEQITLAGESAGAKSVCNLLAVADTRALIRAAIISSGTGDCVNSLAEAEIVTGLFIRNIKNDLLTASAQEILNAQALTIEMSSRLYPFRPVIDGEFLTEIPEEVIKSSDMSGLSILAGFNHDDGWFQYKSLSDISNNIDIAAKKLKLTHFSGDDFFEYCRGGQRNDSDYYLGMISDVEYIVPEIKFTENLKVSGARCYLYEFNLKQNTGPFCGYCVHASELPYIWGNYNDSYMSDFSRRDADKLTSGLILQNIWLNFIKNLSPAHESFRLAEYGVKNKTCISLRIDGARDISESIRAKVNYWQDFLKKDFVI